MKAGEIRKMSDEERTELLDDLNTELLHERGVAAMGGAPPNPGRISDLRRTIARIHTINQELKTQRGDQ